MSGGEGLGYPGSVGAGFPVDLLVKADPPAALEWALSLEGHDALNVPRFAMIEWLKRDRAALEAAVAAVPEEAGRVRATGVLAGVLASRGGAAALAWARDLSGPERVEALLQVGSDGRDMASLEAFGALGELHGLADDDRRLLVAARFRGNSAGNWADGARDEFTSWVSEQPEGAMQAAMVGGIVSSWAGRDARAASAWLAEFPPGPSRDAGAEKLVRHIERSDSPSAFQWAAGIGDGQVRSERLERVIGYWKKIDSAAAAAAIAESALSEGDKIALTERMAR